MIFIFCKCKYNISHKHLHPIYFKYAHIYKVVDYVAITLYYSFILRITLPTHILSLRTTEGKLGSIPVDGFA